MSLRGFFPFACMIQAEFDEKLAASQRHLEDAQAARNHAVKRSGTLAKDLGTVLACGVSLAIPDDFTFCL